MKIWLDTVNLSLVERAAKLGVLSGITTNLSLLSQSKTHPLDTLQMLLEAQDGPVAIQVVANEVKGMIEQAEMFTSISEKCLVEIPVVQNGLEAIHYLSQHGTKTIATSVSHPLQALLAVQSGACIVSSSFSKDLHPLCQMQRIVEAASASLLITSIETWDQIVSLLDLNISAIALKDSLFKELIAAHTSI